MNSCLPPFKKENEQNVPPKYIEGKDVFVTVWLELKHRFTSTFSFFFFFFFFFFLRVNSNLIWVHCLCTVYHCSHIKKILKMGPTILFTHLKIILLQCFQFSVFSNNGCVWNELIVVENWKLKTLYQNNF